MNIDERRVFLVDLVDKLNQAGSWSGETHIQKAVYFLAHLTGVELGFPFVLYKYGPYSFDLKSELVFLEDSRILDRKESGPYGSHVSPGKQASAFKALVSTDTSEPLTYLDWIIENVFRVHDNVSELEKDATALYAIKHFKGDNKDRAQTINRIKPHISEKEALSAISRMSSLLETAPSA